MSYIPADILQPRPTMAGEVASEHPHVAQLGELRSAHTSIVSQVASPSMVLTVILGYGVELVVLDLGKLRKVKDESCDLVR